MLYAKIVFSLAIEGPFDYIVPASLTQKIKVGSRVRVSFTTTQKIGYVVGLATVSDIKKLKEISELLDDYPVLNKEALFLTQEISRYYGCSWGEAIDTALPEAIRKGKKVVFDTGFLQDKLSLPPTAGYSAVLLHDLLGHGRWEIYLQEIKAAIQNKRSVIVLLPDAASLVKTKKMVDQLLGCESVVLYRKQPHELEEWVKLGSSEAVVVIGTRSAIFAPVNNLGLIIIDEEENSVYKQDQVPHYHAREVAFWRTKQEKAKLILGSEAPSLESFYLTREGEMQYKLIPRQAAYPQVKIIDIKDLSPYFKSKNIIFFQYLIDSIFSTLNNKGKTLIFLNRKGFATFATCRHCSAVLRCPRCNVNLVYHFQKNMLSCHYCNFKMPAPNICPECNSGYIRYSGLGTEKVESELHRLFPQARIKMLEDEVADNIDDADIFISTEFALKQSNILFDSTCILSIDNSLSRPDLRAAEKTFRLLVSLARLTKERMVIQTGLSKHHCFRSLLKANPEIFYDEELKQRKELDFPPYKHLAIIKLRGRHEETVAEVSRVLFNLLNKRNNSRKKIKLISVNPAMPAKLRGNFYWQILIKTSEAKALVNFLKIHLKSFPHSGIIVTIDMDPI
ncbi:MAG: primosomal protein N' [Candidatus Omnitrophica bacterium]|nr:primosomal protein N' [Candidatus Omnitrophota bacterium]